MELETAMRGMTGHMSAWDPNEGMPDLPPTPYTGVFLLENANLVGQSAYSFEAAWDMAAAALFEEISGGTLAERMHRIRVIKEFETFSPFYPLLPSDFDGVKLAFSKGYSSFGHSELTAKNQAGSASGRDPLLTELLEKPPAERQELIMRLFREAMPWIDADLSGLGVGLSSSLACWAWPMCGSGTCYGRNLWPACRRACPPTPCESSPLASSAGRSATWSSPASPSAPSRAWSPGAPVTAPRAGKARCCTRTSTRPYSSTPWCPAPRSASA
jgi:hypothetical protein